MPLLRGNCGKKGVITIVIADEAFYAFERMENPRSVPVGSVTEMRVFDEG